MARASKPRSHGFSFQGFDKDHYRQTEGYVRVIDQLYMAAVADFARLAGSVKVDPAKPFDFASSPAFQAKVQKIVNTLAKSMTAVIQHGTQEQWLFACRKNDEFLAHIMDTTKVGKRQLNRMQDRNLDALDQFQRRKVDGLDLSQRVWKYAGQTKELMEMGIDIAVGDGRSAADLSRDLREYLVEPHKLFRRVRDRYGNLVLSQHAAQYHPGQGVYRSSYKNALRLASTEINMAYRDSDRYRWNNLDFVVGYRVHLSNNHTLNGEPFHDICDELAGDYPKDFIFMGWHPNCRCFVTPILQDPDEFNTDELNTLKSAFFGTELKKYLSRKTVTDVPPGFHAWVKAHREAAKGWRKQPYWIRDNFAGGTLEGGLKLVKPVIPKPEPKTEDRFVDLSEDEQRRIRARWRSICSEQLYNEIDEACKLYHVSNDLFNDLYLSMPQGYLKMDQLESETKRLIAELDAVATNMEKTAKDLAAQAVALDESVKIWSSQGGFKERVADAWTYVTDRWPNYPSLNRAFTTMIDQANQYVDEGKSAYRSVLYDCAVVIKKAMENKIDASTLISLIKTQPSSSKTAPELMCQMRGEMNRVEDEIARDRVKVEGTVPSELAIGAQYMRGEQYKFDQSFFKLIDPKRKITLEITDKNDGSYSSFSGDLVHIASDTRAMNSPWEKKAVIYHEYGHCIDAQRDLWQDPALISMRNSQIRRLKKKTNLKKWGHVYDERTGRWVMKRVESESLVEYIDHRLTDLGYKIQGMDDVTFTKRGITKFDVLEQIGAARDTIKSLVVKFGFGHSSAYFRRPRMKETEYLAHAFENAFIGNRVFQKVMPDIYDEMVQYIKTLKPY